MKKCIALILVVIMVVIAVFPSVAFEWHKEEYAEVGDFTGKKISILGDSISTFRLIGIVLTIITFFMCLSSFLCQKSFFSNFLGSFTITHRPAPPVL